MPVTGSASLRRRASHYHGTHTRPGHKEGRKTAGEGRAFEEASTALRKLHIVNMGNKFAQLCRGDVYNHLKPRRFPPPKMFFSPSFVQFPSLFVRGQRAAMAHSSPLEGRRASVLRLTRFPDSLRVSHLGSGRPPRRVERILRTSP